MSKSRHLRNGSFPKGRVLCESAVRVTWQVRRAASPTLPCEAWLRAALTCRPRRSRQVLLFGSRSDAGLFRPGNTTPRANSIASLIYHRSPAWLTGTKNVSSLILDTVAGATEEFAILIVHHSAPRRRTNNFTALIGGTVRIGLRADCFAVLISDTAATLGENLSRRDA